MIPSQLALVNWRDGYFHHIKTTLTDGVLRAFQERRRVEKTIDYAVMKNILDSFGPLFRSQIIRLIRRLSSVTLDSMKRKSRSLGPTLYTNNSFYSHSSTRPRNISADTREHF